MTPAQKLELRRSEVRQRLGELSALEGDAFTEDSRAETDRLAAEYRDLETRHRAALIAGDVAAEDGTTTTEAPEGDRERAELRARATLGGYLSAALSGRAPTGAEGELLEASGGDPGTIPLELFDAAAEARAAEVRADTASTAPGTVGVNLDPIRPMIYARAVGPRLGIAMPRVRSGSFATGTVTTGLSAGAMAAGAARESSAAAITVATSTPHRISARLSIRIEDIAAIGQGNFEAILRQNLMLALTAELDNYVLNGDGSDPNPTGLLARLTDPEAPGAVATWAGFIAEAAAGIDGGPWGEGLGDVTLLVNAETMRLAETTFQAGTAGTDTPGEVSAAAYLRQRSGGFFASARMPDTVSKIAQAIRYRTGTRGLGGVNAGRAAVCPVWSQVAIDDIYSDSASGTRHVTLHHLVGDVIVEQADAYAQTAFKLA